MTVGGADADIWPRSILLAGAGNMGSALLEAWVEEDRLADALTVVEPHPSTMLLDVLRRCQIPLNPPAHESDAREIVVLAVKPQVLSDVAPQLHAFVGPQTTLVSIVAGRTIADLRLLFPKARVVARAMPNTAAAVRKGVTGIALDERADALDRQKITHLLEAVGSVEWLPDEQSIDIVTAVSGSGPAYVFYMTECLAAAARRMGLEDAVAMRIARATVQGAGALMDARPDEPPETLRQKVTSPGGTTAAALAVLMQEPDGLQALMANAVAAAAAQAAELGAIKA